jgi:hypothetical protein
MTGVVDPFAGRSEFLVLIDRIESLGRRLDRLSEERSNVTPMFLTKRALATNYCMSLRWVDDRVADGMPVARRVSGKLQFKLVDTDAWLKQHGFLEELGAR